MKKIIRKGPKKKTYRTVGARMTLFNSQLDFSN